MAVQEDAASLGPAELELEVIHDAATVEVEDDAALAGVPADELGVEMCPVRMAERGVVDGLDDIRLALGIRAEEDVDARLQRELELRIVPIISQL